MYDFIINDDIYATDLRRRIGFGGGGHFGGFGRPFGFGYGFPFLGGLAAGALLSGPFYGGYGGYGYPGYGGYGYPGYAPYPYYPY